MRFLLDEAVPGRLATALASYGCQVDAFPLRWKGLQNGVLLTRIVSAGFDGLLTCDKNMRFQQSFRDWRLSLVVLPAQRFLDLSPLAPEIARALASLVRPSVVVFARNGDFKTQPLD